jgi:hypothetical protein
MAFDFRNLSVLAYANGFTLWHCKTTEALAATSAPGFFDVAIDMLAGGDLLMISAADGARIMAVAPPTGGHVVLAPLA